MIAIRNSILARIKLSHKQYIDEGVTNGLNWILHPSPVSAKPILYTRQKTQSKIKYWAYYTSWVEFLMSRARSTAKFKIHKPTHLRRTCELWYFNLFKYHEIFSIFCAKNISHSTYMYISVASNIVFVQFQVQAHYKFCIWALISLKIPTYIVTEFRFCIIMIVIVFSLVQKTYLSKEE